MNSSSFSLLSQLKWLFNSSETLKIYNNIVCCFCCYLKFNIILKDFLIVARDGNRFAWLSFYEAN